MKQKEKISIPSFANSFYSLAHESIYDKSNKARLSKQIQHILMDFLNTKSMKKKVCLDIGCATGTITTYLSTLFDNTTGIDVDEPAIKKAQNQNINKNLKFELGSGEKLKYAANSFDVVVCQEVYENVDEPEKLLREIYRVLKPKGICYFVADNLLFPIESQYKIPFLLYLPDRVAQIVLRLLGYKKFYLGHFKTYWGLKKLCDKFIVHDYTLAVLRNPERYKFTKLYKHKKLVNKIPRFMLKVLYFFVPTYIWILEKPKKIMA